MDGNVVIMLVHTLLKKFMIIMCQKILLIGSEISMLNSQS